MSQRRDVDANADSATAIVVQPELSNKMAQDDVSAFSSRLALSSIASAFFPRFDQRNEGERSQLQVAGSPTSCQALNEPSTT